MLLRFWCILVSQITVSSMELFFSQKDITKRRDYEACTHWNQRLVSICNFVHKPQEQIQKLVQWGRANTSWGATSTLKNFAWKRIVYSFNVEPAAQNLTWGGGSGPPGSDTVFFQIFVGGVLEIIGVEIHCSRIFNNR